MAGVSIETIRAASKKFQQTTGRAENQNFDSGVSIETIRAVTPKVQQKRYDNLMTSIDSASSWTSQSDMDKIIATVQSFAMDYEVDQTVFNDIMDGLKNNKNIYSKFETADEYKTNMKEYNLRQEHKGYTRADVQKAIERLTQANKLAGIEDETEEIKWLKNYGMNVGYSDSQSYVDEIAAVDAQLKAIADEYSSLQNHVSPGDRGPGQNEAYENVEKNQARKIELDKEAERLNTIKSYLERKLKEVQAEETIKQNYAPFTQAADFETKAVVNNEIDDPLYQLANDTKWTGDDVEYFKAQGDVHLYSFLENDEKKLYLYLANEQGIDEANQYFDTMRPILNARKNKVQTESVQKFADSVPVLDDILTLGSQLIDGVIMAPVKFIGSLTGDYEKNWASYDTFTTFTNTIRTDTALDLNQKFGSEWAGFAYNVTMSILDMGAAIALGKGVSALAGAAGAVTTAKQAADVAKTTAQIIMSSGAASQTMTDARERGLNGIQIAALGVASAGIEALTEKIGLDELFGNVGQSFIKRVGKQIVAEGAEEGLSNVLNFLADEVISGNESQLKQRIQDLMAGGASYEQATQTALLEKVEELGMDVLAGALSGGVFGTGAFAIDQITTVHFSVPGKYKSDLPSAQSWVVEKFQNLKNNITVKKLGTVSYDAATMRDAIGKTKNADQAVAFLAVPDALHKNSSVVEVQEGGKLAVVGAFVSLNGNSHTLSISAQQKVGGGYFVNGVTLDGEAIYDASAYVQQARNSQATEATTGGESLQRPITRQGESDFASGSGDNIALSAEDADSYMKTGKTLHTRNKKQRMLSAGKNPVLTTLSEIKDFILSAIRGSASGEVRAFGIVGERLANAISSVNPRIDVYGNYIELNADDLRESYKRHAKPKEAGDIPLSETDFVNIPDHLNHFDYVLGTNVYNGKIEIHLAKKIAEGYVHVITVSSIERGSLQVTKLIGVSANKFESKYGKKIERIAGSPRGQTANAEDSNPSTTARLTAGDSSIDTIPQAGDGVNTYDMQKTAENSVSVDGDVGVIGVRASALDRTFMDMSEDERSLLISAFEKNTGTRVVFDETIGADGKYENGVIYVNPNTATPMTVIKHELTHHLEQSGSYADFMNFVFEDCDSFRTWLRSKGHSSIDSYAKQVVDDRAESEHPLGQNGVAAEYEAQQEILADFCGEMLFRDVNALSELAQKNRNLFQRIWDWVKGLFTRYEGTAMEKELREIEQRFAQVVQERKTIDPKAQGRKHAINPNFAVEYAAWDKKSTGGYFVIGTTSKALQSIGINPSKIYWDKSKIVDILNNPTHYMEDAITQVPELLENPIIIMQSTTQVNRVVVLGDVYDAHGNPVLCALELTPRGSIKNLVKIASAYGKEGRSSIQSMIDESDILYLDPDKNRTDSWFQTRRLQLPVGVTNYGPIGRVTLVQRNVKGEISFGSQGTAKTPMQLAFEQAQQNATNTQSMQNGRKYSIPTLADPADTAETSIADTVSEEPKTLDQFTDEQLRAEMRRRHPKGDLGDIANLKPEDASTTPDLTSSGVRNRKSDGESAFAEGLQGADIFDDRFKELAAADSKISRYDRIANKETMEAANKALNEGGQAYVNEWMSKKTTAFTAEDVAVGFILMSRYQTVGDYKNEVIIAEKLREAGTQSGQTVQIFSILGRMTPQGMLLYAQKELNSAYEHLVKGQSNRWVEENKSRFDLTDQDVEFIQRRTWQAAQLPDGRDKNILLAEIAARIQDKIPPEKGQAYKAWQRTAMLLNPKTQIRNVLGNATMVPAFVASDFIGTGIDKALGKVTGVRTTSITRLSGKAFKQGLFESWDDFARHINTRNIDADRFEISGRSSKNFNEQHTGFAAGARNNLSKALNALDRFNSFLLEAGDRSFYQMWFVNSLNSQMKANKITDRSQITADMVETATQEALQRTWQDTNRMTKAVNKIKDAMNTLSVNGYGLGDVVIKFVKTPANLTKAMFEFSPAGLAKTLAIDAARFMSAVREGRVTAQMQRTFVKNLSNGITGTILMAIGAALAQAGWITGEKDEDKDVAAFDRYVRGYQPYSVKIGNTSFSYDWMMPIGSSWAMAANYFDGKREGDDKNALQVVRDAISTGGQVLFDQSFMRSIQTLFSEDDILTSIVTGVLSDVSAPIPQALSQAAASFDSVVRNTYEYDDDVQTAWNKILYRIPGLRQTLAPSVDVMGNEIKQIDNGVLRTIVSFFSPMNVGKGYDSKAADEIYRLYQATGEAAVIPSQAPNYVALPDGKKRTLRSHEKAEYQKKTGGMIAESVEKLLSDKRYGTLSDDEKAALLSNIYSYAKQKANNEVLKIEMNESATKADGVISQGVPLYEYFLIRKTVDANDNGSISQEEAKAVLEVSDLTKAQKSLMWTSFNSGWKYNPYGKRYY